MDRKAKIAELEKELRSLESGAMKRVSASGGERTKDVTKERIAELKAKIAKLVWLGKSENHIILTGEPATDKE